jgi:O-antigen/teichoic acid export membrane protein
MMVLSKPIIATLFQEKYPSAPFFLAVAVAGNLLVAIGNLSLSGLLAGLGETKMLMKLSIPTLLISLPLAFVLVPTFGITGVILGPLLSALPSLFLGLRWAWNHYEVKADLGSSARIIAASTIATIITYFFLSLFSAFEWIRLVTGAIIFFTVYILSAPLVGAITQSDTKNLRDMFSGFVGISRIFNTLLVLIEKVTTLRSAEEANSS